MDADITEEQAAVDLRGILARLEDIDMKYRALIDLSYRTGRGWLDIKAGDEFTPPKTARIAEGIERGYFEAVEEVKHED